MTILGIQTLNDVPKIFKRGQTLEFIMDLPADVPADYFGPPEVSDGFSTEVSCQLRKRENAAVGGLIAPLVVTWEPDSDYKKLRFKAENTENWSLGPAEFDVVLVRSNGVNTYTKTQALVTGTPETVLSSGCLATSDPAMVNGNLDQLSKFGLWQGPVTLVEIAAWQAEHNYGESVIVASDGKIWFQQNLAGTSGTVAPSGAVGSSFIDGDLYWYCIGEGTGAAYAIFQSVEPGEVHMGGGALSHVLTQIPGWLGIFNPLDEMQIGNLAVSKKYRSESVQLEIADGVTK